MPENNESTNTETPETPNSSDVAATDAAEPIQRSDAPRETESAASESPADASVGPDSAPAPDPQRPVDPDPVLLGAVDLARNALLEATGSETIGAFVGHKTEEEHVLSLLFENRLDGYPGWFWTVTLARVDGGAPTIVETELMPGETAILAPDWVPWSERLAEYRAQQEEAAREAEAEAEAESDDDDEDDDDESLLHSGDLDGVDVDELDNEAIDDGAAQVVESAASRSKDAEEDADDDSDSASRGTGRGGRRRRGRRGTQGRRRSRGRRKN